MSFPSQVRALTPAENLQLLPRGQKLSAETPRGKACSLLYAESPLAADSPVYTYFPG